MVATPLPRPAEAIMRSIVQTGPVVAYLFVLPPNNAASLYYYDPASGGRRLGKPQMRRCIVCTFSGTAWCPQQGHVTSRHLASLLAGSYPASVCDAGNPSNKINHAVVRANAAVGIICVVMCSSC